MTDHNIVRMVHAIEERISGGGAADNKLRWRGSGKRRWNIPG